MRPTLQRIMLAASWPESVGETHEVLLVDRLQYRHDCLLDNLVLQAPDAQRSLRTVRLRDVAPFGWACSIAAFVNPLVQVCQLCFEIVSVGVPHAIDPGRFDPFRSSIPSLWSPL
jgi:hypothetical protein